MRNSILAEIISSDRYHIKQNVGDDNLRYNLWGRFVLKNLSYFVVWALLKMRMSANAVTYAGFAIGCLGCLLIALGGEAGLMAGVVLVNIWALLDYSDGQVARWNGTSGNYGRFIDNICDAGMGGLLFLFLGIGVYNSVEEYIYLIVGAWTALCYLFTMIISYNFERLISPQLTDFVSGLKVKGLPVNLVQMVGFNFQNVTGIIMPVIILGAILGYLHIVLVMWAIIGTGSVAFMAYSMIRKAGRTR